MSEPQDRVEFGDRQPARHTLPAPGLEHIRLAAVDPAEVATPEGRQAVADQLVAAMRAWPSATAVVGVVPTSSTATDLIVAGPPNAVQDAALAGVYEVNQRLCSSKFIKENAKAYPSEYHPVTSYDPQGKTDRIRIPGPHNLSTVGRALLEGRQPNQEDMIAELIDRLPKGQRAVVLLPGPSGAGKSTLLEKMSQMSGGRDIVPLQGDMYFLDVDDSNYPRNKDGSHYWDHRDVMDRELLKQNLSDLVTTGEADVPVYDFRAKRPGGWRLPDINITGMREPNPRHVTLGQDDILVLDSLHAADPDVVGHLESLGLPRASVYVDTPSSDDRLMRRIVRDYHHRGGQTPEQTLEIWDKTTWPGEVEFVRPTMKTLDPARDLVLISSFPAEPRLTRAELEEKQRVMNHYGLMPEYDTYKVPADRLDELALAEETRFSKILAESSDDNERAKAEKGLRLLRSAPGYQGEHRG
ncbi:MAG: hypothetical protein HY319_19040 [Armatimonadetes bacterium]|nr:hypothetical protein [Armatimonadota bacterium]